MSHAIIDRLRTLVNEIGTDKKVSTTLDVGSRVYVSALIRNSDKGSYKEYVLPNTEDEVLLYWIDDKYDEIEDTSILHHYKSDIVFAYDNGIRSVDENGEATYEEDVEDTLYIRVNSVSELEEEFNTVEKRIAHITPHVDAITAYIYDVVASNGTYELIDQRVLGYKITDVDTVVGELQSDWKSHQLIGNLIVYEDTV